MPERAGDPLGSANYSMKTCPVCGRECLPLAPRCICGHVFGTDPRRAQTPPPAAVPQTPESLRARRILLIGASLFGIAVFLSAAILVSRMVPRGGAAPNGTTAALASATPAETPTATPTLPLPTLPDGPVVTPTPAPATPKATPRPTNDWNTGTYKTAMAYTDDMNSTYVSKIPSAIGSCSTLTDAACQRQIAAGVTAAANAHVSWMSKHTPAHCFADAYSDDKGIAKSYLSAATALKGGDVTGWQTKVAAAKAQSSSFIHNFSSYFKDCK